MSNSATENCRQDFKMVTKVAPEKALGATESGYFDEEEELETVLKQYTKTKFGFKKRPSIVERE
jgi:hypothetical protein